MQFTATTATQSRPAAFVTAYPLSVSLKLHSSGRCKRMGKKVRAPEPKVITHSAMKQGLKGTRGVPNKKWSVAVSQVTAQAKAPRVPFHVELLTLRIKLNPYNIGDMSAAVIPILRARLEVLEKRASIVAAHRKAKFGTAVVASMAIKPELTADELRRSEISAEICAAGGFVGPRGPRKAVIAGQEVVKRVRRPRGAAKVKVGWLDVVETTAVSVAV